MTGRKTGTCEEWLAARLDLLRAEKELARRSGGNTFRGLGSTRTIDARRARAFAKGARSSLPTTSCLGPISSRAVQPAWPSPIASMESRFIGLTMKFMLWAASGCRSRSRRRTKSEYIGRFHGYPSSAATSASTSIHPKENSARIEVATRMLVK